MVNHIVGDGIANTLSGFTNSIDWIEGLGGDDKLKAVGKGDTLDGGEGNDTLIGGSGDHLLLGGTGNDSVTGSSSTDTLDGGEGNDTLDGGSGNDVITHGSGADTVWGGSGNDIITVSTVVTETSEGGHALVSIDAVVEPDGADWINAGSGDDLVHAGDANDTIIGDSGNDTIYGDANDDLIYGDSGKDWLAGGTDDGTYSPNGGTNVSVEFLSSITAVYDNIFGYYVKNGLGEPTVGKVLIASTLTSPPSVTDIPGVNPADIGFFLVGNGAALNPGAASDGTDVTFAQVGGHWVAHVGGVPLDGYGAGGVEQPMTFFTDTGLNFDGIDHEQDSATEGESNWEDLFGGGDLDYNDANFNLEVTNTPAGLEGGDTLWGGSGTDTFYYTIGVDGVDTIKDFGVTGFDTLALAGGTAADVSTYAFGTGAIVEILSGGAVYVENVTVAYLEAHTSFV